MAALAGGVVLVLAGCGGKKSYTLAKTRECLAGEPAVTVSRKVDFVASTAAGGALTAKLSENQVTISFGESEDEAEQIARGYRRVHGKNIGIDDVLRPDHNAVLLWQAHPSEADIAAVNGCLR